ncbi:MAG: AAA family ATPase [Bacteroidia bacterium]
MKAERGLPIGIQDFSDLVLGNYIYVDKTKYYHRLITTGKYYFISRPRRFGKSLFISTLKEIFDGNQDLFKGLWIHDKIDWEPRPVISLDFSEIVSRDTPFAESLNREMDTLAAQHGLAPMEGDYSYKFRRLIEQLGTHRKVAILVDEYDKPIINFMDDMERVQENRAIMKNFYSVIKGNDAHIALFMLTGVSKFSQVSIFSDLNNLNDISLDDEYAAMLGYTQQEIEDNFPTYLDTLQTKLNVSRLEMLAEMKAWYNGYSWDGESFMYNPFSILNLLSKRRFQDYWFATGTPTFLMSLIRTGKHSVFDLENREVSLRAFNQFELPNIEIKSLLFQTGYLTIKKFNDREQSVTLDFPNHEVANAFSFHLLAEFAEKTMENTDSLIRKLDTHLKKGEAVEFVATIRALFAGIGYPIQPDANSGIENYEKYYHSMFYLVLRLLGHDIQAEVFTHDGRIDAVISANGHIYIVEFKLGDAAAAMAQIKSKDYHQAYMGRGKKVILLGIGFDVVTRNVSDFLVEEA